MIEYNMSIDDLEERISDKLKLLREIDNEIDNLKNEIHSTEHRLKSLSETAFDILSNILIEKNEGIYILNGRLPNAFVSSLKSKGIIRFVEDDYLWYVEDIKQFVKRIEYRIKRGLDVSCSYTYKNVKVYKYETRLAEAIEQFNKVSLEIEWLEKLSQGERCEPLHLYSTDDRNLYYQSKNSLTRLQKEYNELVMFVEMTENIPTSVFKLLATQQELLLNEIVKTNELLHSLKRKYS